MSTMCIVLKLCVCLCWTHGLQYRVDQGPLYTLYNDLLEHYKPHIRPRKIPNETVDVLVSYSMVSVETLDESTQTLNSFGYLTLEWTDDLLTWNSGRYGDITNITISAEKLWIPDMILVNGLGDMLFKPQNVELARVNNNGRVTWYKAITKRTKCSLDMTKFPFDTQTCSINIMQWASVVAEVNITANRVEIDLIMFQQNGEWEIVGQKKDTIVHTYSEVMTTTEAAFTFIFKRKYLYYIITNILPVMLLSVLNLGVFLLPPESGEKVSLCISIVLSYAVFLSVIGESLPEVSDTVSIFSIYLLAMMFLKVTTTLITVAILNVYHGETAKEYSCGNISSLKTHETEIVSPPDEKRNGTSGNMSEQDVPKELNKQLAARLNKIGFSIVFSLTVIFTIVCFVLLLKL